MQSKSDKTIERSQNQIQDLQNKPVELLLKSHRSEKRSLDTGQEETKHPSTTLLESPREGKDKQNPPDVNQKTSGKFSHLKLNKKEKTKAREEEEEKEVDRGEHLEAESGTRFNKFKIQLKNKPPTKQDLLANISYSDQEGKEEAYASEKLRKNVTDSSPLQHRKSSSKSDENEKEQEQDQLALVGKKKKKVNFHEKGSYGGKSGQESPERSDSEFEDEEEQNDIVPGFDNMKNQFDDSLINDLQKDSSFFSYKKDKGEDLMKNFRKVKNEGSSQGSQVKISPIEMIINQGRSFTPTIPFMRENSDRAPTPTMNRPSFRTKMQFSADARRAQTPAPHFDDQIQSRRNALEILNIQRQTREDEQTVNEAVSVGNGEQDSSIQVQQPVIQETKKHDEEVEVHQVRVLPKPTVRYSQFSSRLLKALRIDLSVLSFSLLLLAAFFYLEIFHMYALILVPVSELVLLLAKRPRKQDLNKISDKSLKQIIKKNTEQGSEESSIQICLRWTRWVSKILTTISFIVLWIVGETTYLYVSIIPCVVASLISLLAQAIKFSKEAYLSYHLLVFKFVRSLAFLQLMLVLKENGDLATLNFVQPRSQTWPIIIYFAVGLPANVILVFYSVFFKLRQLKKHPESFQRESIHGLGLMLLLYTSISVFLGLFVRYLNYDVPLIQNSEVRRLCIAAGVFYALIIGLSLFLQSGLKALYSEVYNTHGKSDPENSKIGEVLMNKIEPISMAPPQAPTGSTTRVLITPSQRVALMNEAAHQNDTMNVHETSISPVTSNVQNTSRNIPAEQIAQLDKTQNEGQKSEFSFHYVEKQNSVMFHNIKKENLNNLTELEQSLAQSRQPPNQDFRNASKHRNIVGHLDTSGADSMLNFSLPGKLLGAEELREPPKSKFVPLNQTSAVKSSQFKVAHQREKKNTQVSQQGVHNLSLDPQYRIYTPQVGARMKRNQNSQQERMNEIETELNLTKNAERMYIMGQTRENKRSLASLEEVNSKRYILRELHQDDEDSLNGTSVLGKEDQSKISKLDVTQKRERYNSLFSENPFAGIQFQQNYPPNDMTSTAGLNQSPILKKREKDDRSEAMESNYSKSRQNELKKKSAIQMLIETNQEQEASMLLENGVKLCHVCMEEQPDAIFHPCGHGGLCFNCAQIIVETNANCHYCRKPLEKVLKINLKKQHKNIYRVLEVFKVISQESIEEL